MARPSKYPDELRERAVRMVAEVRPQYPSEWAAMKAVARLLGMAPRRRCASGCARPRSTPVRRRACTSAGGRGAAASCAGRPPSSNRANVILGWVDCLGA